MVLYFVFFVLFFYAHALLLVFYIGLPIIFYFGIPRFIWSLTNLFFICHPYDTFVWFFLVLLLSPAAATSAPFPRR